MPRLDKIVIRIRHIGLLRSKHSRGNLIWSRHAVSVDASVHFQRNRDMSLSSESKQPTDRDSRDRNHAKSTEISSHSLVEPLNVARNVVSCFVGKFALLDRRVRRWEMHCRQLANNTPLVDPPNFEPRKIGLVSTAVPR